MATQDMVLQLLQLNRMLAAAVVSKVRPDRRVLLVMMEKPVSMVNMAMMDNMVATDKS